MNPFDIQEGGNHYKEMAIQPVEYIHKNGLGCGSDSNLHVHHIKGAHEYPDSRFDPLNGISLCAECHSEFHRIFGRRKGFTESDAEKFVNSPIEWLVTRHNAKNGIEDLKKARHFLDLLIEMEQPS